MIIPIVYYVLVFVTIMKNEVQNMNINTLLIAIIILLANMTISICSRLDDLKRK